MMSVSVSSAKSDALASFALARIIEMVSAIMKKMLSVNYSEDNLV